MKNLTILTLFLALAVSAVAQDDFNQRWEAAYALADEMKYEAALQAFEPLLAEQPTNASTHIQMAWCYLMQGDKEAAMEHAFTSYQIDPLYFATHTICAYLMYAAGQEEGGKVFLDNSIWLIDDEATLDYYEEDIAEMEKNGENVASLRKDFAAIKENLGQRNRQWEGIYSGLIDGINKIGEGDFANAKTVLKKCLMDFEGVPDGQQHLGFVTAYVIGSHFYNASDSANYMPVLNMAYGQMKQNSTTSVLPLIHMSTMLGEHYYSTGNYEKSFEVLYEGLTFLSEISKFRFLTYYKAMYLIQYAQSAYAVGNLTEARDAARLVTEVTHTGFDEWYQTNGWICMAQAWSDDAAKSREYYQKAYDMAVQYGFEDLKNSVTQHLD